MRVSTQPQSKWSALYNLEQIKERNKAILPKKDVPKAPFFLFDIGKVLLESEGTSDLIKEKYFTE